MEEKQAQNTWLMPFDPEKILETHLFFIIGNQILFRYKGQIVISQITAEENYTEEDYYLLPEGAPYELINGKLEFMATPRISHQLVSRNLMRYLDRYVYDCQLGEMISAPMDVRLDDNNVVQPDILFVSNERKEIMSNGLRIIGAPDFAIEILLPSNKKRDRVVKLALYGKFGVAEYWIVDIDEEKIEVYHNKNKELQLVQTVEKKERIKSLVIEGFELEVAKVFE